MTDRHVLVYIDLDGRPQLVGRLWGRVRNGRESATFEYDNAWLKHPQRFPLEPALALGKGPLHTVAARRIFGAIGDSAPDRWGRVLIQRDERRKAREENRAPHTLGEIDYLLAVGDTARQGALRFAAKEGGPFLADGVQIPPLIRLSALLNAALRVTADKDTDEDLKLLLAPGSSLGGARPKVSVIDRDGNLSIAKFPQKNDLVRVSAWEAVALTLAAKAGLPTPDWRLEKVGDRAVLLLRRFDRQVGQRIPFLSAMSMLGATDNDNHHTYLDIAEALRQQGAVRPTRTCERLWRRIVLNVLISNTRTIICAITLSCTRAKKAGGSSPAYDINPVPLDVKPRILSYHD